MAEIPTQHARGEAEIGRVALLVGPAGAAGWWGDQSAELVATGLPNVAAQAQSADTAPIDVGKGELVPEEAHERVVALRAIHTEQ